MAGVSLHSELGSVRLRCYIKQSNHTSVKRCWEVLRLGAEWSGERRSHTLRSCRMAGSILVTARSRDPSHHRGFGE